MHETDDLGPKKQILVADDDTAIRTVLIRALTRKGYEVRATANVNTLWNWIANDEGDAVISDVAMPDGNVFDFMQRIKNSRPNLPVLIMSAQNTLMTAIRANEEGAFDYLPKPFDLNVLLATLDRALEEANANRIESSTSEEEANQEFIADDGTKLVGRSPAMQEVYRVLARMMQTDLTMLITGESGTGKEVVARVLHDFGKRKNGPFVAINMAAIPRDLIETELFGHEKGAFTGADTKSEGQFAHAEGGTLFLDEIGDMPMEAQTRLLRVLQQGEYTSVGARIPIKTNVRIIAATNKNLQHSIANGTFREDLYYRLNVVHLRLPPLRERREDIALLMDYFVKKDLLPGQAPKLFDGDTIAALKAHEWPGNVRELENLARRLNVLYQQETITSEIISNELTSENPNATSQSGAGSEQFDNLEILCLNYFRTLFDADKELPHDGVYQRHLVEFERPIIRVCLKAVNGNQIRAAQLLGLNRNTLRKKMQVLGISAK